MLPVIRHKCYLSTITKILELKFYHTVVRDANWRDAMAKEIEALELNNTWDIVDFPARCKLIISNGFTKSSTMLMEA